MSEETKDQKPAGDTAAAAEATPAVETATATEAAEASPEAPHKEPIPIELEDLTEEGKKKLEESLHRPVPDIPATLAASDKHPGSRVHLKFEVTRESFEAEQGRLLKDLSKEAVLPGYRKGKVPVKLLQIRMGEEGVRDTIRAVATNVLRQENIKNDLKMTIKPHVLDFNIPETAGEPVTFEIEIEVEPQIEVTQYKGLTVQVTTQPVTEEMVAQRLEQMRQENAVHENAPEDAVVSEGDILEADAEVFGAQGRKMENLSHKNWHLHNFRQQLPAPVADAIMGKKAGDSVSVKVPNKTTNRRGEEVVYEDTWEVTLTGIKRNRLPELDDEFAKDLGDYATLEDLKKKVRTELEANAAERERGQAIGTLLRKLAEVNPVDVPQSLRDAQAYELIMRDREELSRYGLKLEHVVQDPNSYLSNQRAGAEELVKASLITEEVAKKENLSVSDEDVEKEIAAIAEKSGRKALAIRARLEAEKQLDQFREQLARKKINDFLLANNTIEKVEGKPEEAAPQADEPGETTV